MMSMSKLCNIKNVKLSRKQKSKFLYVTIQPKPTQINIKFSIDSKLFC